MTTRLLIAMAAIGLLAAGIQASDDPKAAALQTKPKVGAESIIDKLHNQEMRLAAMNLNEIPLVELLGALSKQFHVTFVIMAEQFNQQGIGDIRERKSSLTTAAAKGMTLHRFLGVWLASMDATYLVRGDYIEIIPLAAVANTGAAAMTGSTRPPVPLVSLIVKEKPLNEVIEKLADQYDLSVVIAPQAGDGRAGFVSARLKNVPPEIALELLAVQSDLRVVRRGSAYLITSREHAEGLFHEAMEKAHATIELKRLRQAPPRAEAPPPQAKGQQPLMLKFDLVPQPKAKP